MKTDLLREETVSYKIINSGVQSLTDTELLCVLLELDNNNENLNDVRKILSKFNNNFKDLSNATITELYTTKLSLSKAKVIIAASEFGRRAVSANIPKKTKFGSSRDSYDYIYQYLSDLSVEHFYVIYMDRANCVIDHEQIGIGGMTGVVVDRRVIFRNALNKKRCCKIILCHNHPSGNIKPSEADKEITKAMIAAGKMINIEVLDHLIIGSNAYYSFADEGMM